MIRSLFVQRGRAVLFAATFAGLTALLAACGGGGGGGDGGNAQLRTINLTSDLPSIDVYTGTERRFATVAGDAITSYSGIGAGTYDVKVTAAGNATSLFSGSYSLTKDLNYTAVVWGRNGALRVATLPENDSTADIAAGNSRLRVYNATSDAGSLDVYLTQGIDDLANASAVVAGSASAALSGYRDVSAGTYRLRVTSAGDIGDVRLDLPAVTLTEKQYATLIVTAGPGGVLVNATMLQQQGAATAQKNTQARVRVVAGAADRGSVSVALDGATLAGSLRSPTVGPYSLVTAGARSVDVKLNGTSISTATRTLAAGGDYTLLAFGSDGSGQVQLVADDNRLPGTGRIRLRLVHGAAGVDPLTLSVDYAALISDITAGNGSSFVTSPTNSSARLDVTSTSGIDSLFTATDVNLQSLGVYTVFMLGGNTTPTGVLRKDR